MYRFRIAIIDDDIEEQQRLKEWVAGMKKYRALDCYDSGEAFMESDKRYDILFLNCELADRSGLEIAEKYHRKRPKTSIVLLSAHEENLRLGYKVHAYQVLIKPLEKEAVEEVMEQIFQEQEYQVLVLEYEGKKHLVPTKQIIYIEAGKHGNGVVIRTAERDYHHCEQLSYYEKLLNTEYFVRSHRAYIVNLRYVKEYGKGKVTMLNGDGA